MRAAAIAAVLAACGGAHGAADRDEVAREMVSSDPVQLAAMLRAPLEYGGLWFDDPACQQEFIAPGVVGADRIDAFARCLATLHLTVSAREHPYPDVIVLDYAPGLEIEASVDGDGRIRWIGYSGRHDLRDALPSITPEALESLRSAGEPSPVLGADAKARLARERADLGNTTSHVWLKVCLDADGNVTGAHARVESSPVAGDVFTAAVAQWKFRPFVVGGRAIPVCALRYVSDPAVGPTEDAVRLPLPVPPELGPLVDTKALHRISGQTMIIPDGSDQNAMRMLHVRRIVVAFSYCVDEHGDVAGIRTTRTSGLGRYEARIANAVLGWKFEPLIVEGKAVPACTALKFIYSQSY